MYMVAARGAIPNLRWLRRAIPNPPVYLFPKFTFLISLFPKLIFLISPFLKWKCTFVVELKILHVAVAADRIVCGQYKMMWGGVQQERSVIQGPWCHNFLVSCWMSSDPWVALLTQQWWLCWPFSVITMHGFSTDHFLSVHTMAMPPHMHATF